METTNIDKANYVFDLMRLRDNFSGYHFKLKNSHNTKGGRVESNEMFEMYLRIGLIDQNEFNIINDYLDAIRKYHEDLSDKINEYGNCLNELNNYIESIGDEKNRPDEILLKLSNLGHSKLETPKFPLELHEISSKLPESRRYFIISLQNDFSEINNHIYYLENIVSNINNNIKDFNELGQYNGADYTYGPVFYVQQINEKRAIINKLNETLNSESLSDKDIKIIENDIRRAHDNIASSRCYVDKYIPILDQYGVIKINNDAGIPDYIDITHNTISDNLSVTISGFKVFDSSGIQKMIDDFYKPVITPPPPVN